MDYIIRKSSIDDAEQVGYVHYNSWIETYSGKIHDNYLKKLSPEKSAENFKKINCNNNLVLVVDNRIVGFMSFSKARDKDLNDEFCEIQAIYLLKKYHGLGLGKALLRKAIGKFKEEGFKKVVLWVLDSNAKAISFYEKNGFEFEGKTKGRVIVRPIRELRFIKDIQ